MKVLHLISGGDEGGAKTHVLTLLKELKNNVDITLVCLMRRSFSEEAEKLGINTIVIEQNQRYNLTVVKDIIRILEKDYDLLHCHGARANFIGMLIKRKQKIPIITTIHSDYKSDFDNSLYKKLLYTAINYFSLKHIDYYIAITKQFKKMLANRRFDSKKIYVAYNGLDFKSQEAHMDPSAFLSRHKLSFQKNKTYVGMVTRLHPIKGIPVFLQAARELLKHNKDVIFLIAGDGEKKYTDKYKGYVQKYQMEDYIKFLGFVKDVHNFYQSIDINVLTSYSESFPYALLEGGNFGVATIASAVGGIPEMIDHDKTGMLFEEGNYIELARHIKKLVESSEKMEQLGSNFKKKVKEEYSSESMAKTHMNIYQSIMRGIQDENV